MTIYTIDMNAIDLLIHGHIKENEELPEGCLVHAGDHCHVCDKEVEDGASGGHWSVLFTGTINLAFCL